MPDRKWFYTHEGERCGPVTSANLRSLAAAGKLAADDLIWKEDMADWAPATQLRGLFPTTTATENAIPDANDPFETDEGNSPVVDRPANVANLKEPPPMAAPPVQVTSVELSGFRQPWRNSLLGGLGSNPPLLDIASFGHLILLLGLLMVVLAKGCDGIGNRYVSRLKSQFELAKNQFDDDYEEKLRPLAAENKRITEELGSEAPTREQQEKIDANKEREAEIREEQVTTRAENEQNKWNRMKIRARDAEANNNMWGFWRECLFLLGTVILIIGLLVASFFGKGADRWVCLIILAIVTFSIYVGGIAWISSVTSQIPR